MGSMYVHLRRLAIDTKAGNKWVLLVSNGEVNSLEIFPLPYISAYRVAHTLGVKWMNKHGLPSKIISQNLPKGTISRLCRLAKVPSCTMLPLQEKVYNRETGMDMIVICFKGYIDQTPETWDADLKKFVKSFRKHLEELLSIT